MREVSETGFYHLTHRTAGGIQLFEDDQDRKRYLRILKEEVIRLSVTVIAWCLMDDHIHLLIGVGQDIKCVGEFVKAVDGRYARAFNTRHGRDGHLFASTFWSGPIRSESQLIATAAYIHMNPVKAVIASCEGYRWSSMQEYLGKHWVVDTSLLMSLCGGLDGIRVSLGAIGSVVRQRKRSLNIKSPDSLVVKKALSLAEVGTTTELRSLGMDRRNRTIRLLRDEGASERQISRAFGIGRKVVHKVLLE